jgi:hypothetical protein
MSQKSSVMQTPQFVPKALTSDNGGDPEKLLAACEVDAATVYQALTKA